MFPTSIAKLIDAVIPKLNPALANGLAITHLKYVEEYVDSIFRSAAASFPPDLLYTGCRRCTPQEEFSETTKKKGNRYVFDVARSDVYLMEYNFKYQNEVIKKYLFLPFVSDAGVIYLGGSRFVISPIISDRVISVGISNVFVRLLKARLTFNRIPQHYIVNGVRESVQVAWSDIYNVKQNDNAPKGTVDAKCTLVHYLLCKYGFTEMFTRFSNCQPIVGGEEINSDTYPEDRWVVCSSSCYTDPSNKPKGFGKSLYEPSNIRLAIPKEQFTPMVKNLVGGFFYVVDFFPSRIKIEFLEFTNLWMLLLGHVIWSGNVGAGRLVNDVGDHIASLDDYVDGIVSSKLKDIGFDCTDIYQIFALVIDKFNDWLLSSDDRVNTMYDKELSILYYVCYEISSTIFNLSFKLKAAQKKELNLNKIKNIMNLSLKPGLIFKITRDHSEVTTTSTSGDNKALKTTLLLVPQSSSNRNKSKKDRLAIADPGKRLNASIAEVASYSALPKSEPTGRSRINLNIQINESGLILRNPKHVELIDSVQALIRR